jgi:RHS repeat-associated protein
MVDPVDLRLWRFAPVTGMGCLYTSEFAYQYFIDVDGRREVTIPSICTLTVDALGHSLAFRPVEPAPPHRTYLLTDGSGRSLRFELADAVTFLDGNNPGGQAKSYVVSQVIDLTRNGQNVLEYHYDDQQRLIEAHLPGHAGRAARVVSYDYDPAGHLVQIIDPVGDSFTFEYTEDLLDSDDQLVPRLKLTRITDNEGNAIAYRYDHPNRRVAVTFTGADGNVSSSTFTYEEDTDDTGQRFITSQMTDVTRGYSGAQSVTTSQFYSSDGRYLVNQITDPLGNAWQFEYNDFNQKTATVDPTGHRREISLDVQAAPTPANPNRYDVVGSSEQNFDVNGNTFPVASRASFRSYDNASSGDAADARQSTHRVASRTDELGNVFAYDYDDAANNSPLRPTALSDPLGEKTLRAYDSTGATLSETDPTGNVRSWTYNSQGLTIMTTDPNGFRRYWVYDFGSLWVTDATDALGAGPGDPAHSIHYNWNDAGQRLSDRDAVGAVTEYGYFGNKRLRSVTRYGQSVRTLTFAYDAAGALTGITDPRGHQTVFLVDEAGRLYESFRDLPANPSLRSVFDLGGRVIQMTNRNGQAIRYGYDALGRMTSIQEPNWPAGAPVNPGKSVVIRYDALGQRLEVTDSQLPSPAQYHYDAAGNQRSRSDAFGTVLGYDYNARNELIRVHDPAGQIDLQFLRDDAGALARVTDSNQWGRACKFRYFRTDGNLVDDLYRIEFDASGIKTAFQYDANRRLTHLLHTSGAPLLSLNYNYRADGLTGSVSGDHHAVYDYDGIRQLGSESDAAMRDGYDAIGNRLWRAPLPVPVAQQDVYDADNRKMSSPSDGTTYTYDPEGNRLSVSRGGATVRYTYDAADRLMRVQDGLRTVDYLYDIDDRLLQRRSSGPQGPAFERYRYANRSILAVVDDQARLQVLYTRDDSGRLLRRRTRQTLTPAPSKEHRSTFYLLDGVGSVARCVDWDGHDRLKVDYDAWGISTDQGPIAAAEPFRYRGSFRDALTGMLLFGPRWYDPKIGRWLTQDPLLLRLMAANRDLLGHFDTLANLYAYVGNEPVDNSDATGLESPDAGTQSTPSSVDVCWANPWGFFSSKPLPQPMGHWWIETNSKKSGMERVPGKILAVEWADQSSKYTTYTKPGEIQCKKVPNTDAACVDGLTTGPLGYWYPGNTCQEVVNAALERCTPVKNAGPPAGHTALHYLYMIIGGEAY